MASARIAFSVIAVSISVSPFFTLDLRGMHVDDIGAKPLAGDLERQQRARGVLEKGVDQRQPGESLVALVPLAVELDPLFGFVEQEQDFVRGQPGDPDQSAMRERARSGRVPVRV